MQSFAGKLARAFSPYPLPQAVPREAVPGLVAELRHLRGELGGKVDWASGVFMLCGSFAVAIYILDDVKHEVRESRSEIRESLYKIEAGLSEVNQGLKKVDSSVFAQRLNRLDERLQK